MLLVKLKPIVEAFKDFLWPARCAACNEKLAPKDGALETLPFCTACAMSLLPIQSPLCTRCGLPFDSAGPDHLCGECLKDPPPFVRARTLFEYGAAAREAVLRLKYGNTPWVGEVLGRRMSDLLNAPDFADSSAPPDILVPVPLHRKRLIARGFNQAALLAAPCAALLRRPIRANVLLRVRETSPQAGQSRSERFENLRGAFVCARESEVRGRRVLLIDDVITTGATVREAARTLIKGGAISVTVVAFARTC